MILECSFADAGAQWVRATGGNDWHDDGPLLSPGYIGGLMEPARETGCRCRARTAKPAI